LAKATADHHSGARSTHYVIGVDDAYIAEGTYASRTAALRAARAMLADDDVWKADIECRDEDGHLVWVEVVFERD
jgi:hypothetical protein